MPRFSRQSVLNILSLVMLTIFQLLIDHTIADDEVQVLDNRLELTLFADESQIVTPIGMAIDARDRIFVIESHTHLPPNDYAGPKSDRIKVFEDSDFDGRPDRMTVFADGLSQSMNLAISPAGNIYVVTARSVVRLDDKDDDGRAESKTNVLSLKTTERYAHNSLLSLTFDSEGRLYVGRGNTGSRHYRLEGSDGSFVEGYGDGGDVIVCDENGNNVQRFATGFWNPFDLKFDLNGNLLLVDNDPDARGPNRLLKVASGGDYGYKSIYGGSGNHPFQGWDGSLPGTLPYISGTGEAPSGLIDLRRSNFPTDYRDSVLATIWNENSIECFRLDRSKPTIQCVEKSVLLKGGKNFRPVAMDCDSRGNLYVTDWMLVDYPNHGRGRIWRVSNRQPDEDAIQPHKIIEKSSGVSTSTSPDTSPKAIRELLNSDDKFDWQAGYRALKKAAPQHIRALLLDGTPNEKVAALLAAKNNEVFEEVLPRLLKSENEDVRLATLMTAAESHRLEFADVVDEILTSKTGVSERLAQAWLATKSILTPDFVNAFNSRATDRSNQLARKIPPGTTWKLAGNESLPPSSRAIGIRLLNDKEVQLNAASMLDWIDRGSSPELAISAAERLLSSTDDNLRKEAEKRCLAIAADESADSVLRYKIIDAIARSTREFDLEPIIRLISQKDEEVALAAASLLQNHPAALTKLEPVLSTRIFQRVREQLLFVKYGNAPNNPDSIRRPQTLANWKSKLTEGGVPHRGRRVFESSRTGCAGCHSMNGLGSQLGPDLSGLALSKSREQVIDAILQPSAEYAPQYQAWLVITDGGKIFRGLQLDHKSGGAIMMTLADGTNRRFEADEIDDYQASPSSLMPADLQNTMTVSEFQDLIAYLMQSEE